MKHQVLQPFPCRVDATGTKAEELQVGDERDFGELAEGLLAAGLIGPLPDPPPPAPALMTLEPSGVDGLWYVVEAVGTPAERLVIGVPLPRDEAEAALAAALAAVAPEPTPA